MEKYISNLLNQLSLDEKIGMIHGCAIFHTQGVERLNIPELVLSDGPMGVRAELSDEMLVYIGQSDDYSTYLPSGSSLASTFNRELAGLHGQIHGEEARGRGKDVILGPGINIKRSPLCGRNFEYMSEDPYLISELVVPQIKGIQKYDVAACVKHFACNSQETNRMEVDTLVSERAKREIYFKGFEAAIKKAESKTIMGAYNKLDGKQCCHNSELLDGVLRDEWEYDGVIVSDWGGVHDTLEAVNSALDVEMDIKNNFDNYYMASPLKKLVSSGKVSERLIDEKVRNILRLMYRLKMIGPKKNSRIAGAYNTKEHIQGALDIAREGVILLKNDKGILPLSRDVKRVVVIGKNAVIQHSFGGGSAEMKALYEITPLMGIKKLLGGNARVEYVQGYVSNDEELNKEKELFDEAINAAKNADLVIFVGGLTHARDTEGTDRPDMRLRFNQDKLIDALLDVNKNTAVVLCTGSVVELPWVDKCHALVASYYNGMEGGTALAEVLFGEVNPSGHLAETWIKRPEDCRAISEGGFGNEDCVEYKEDVYVGYRDYDTRNVDVNFCFGHGLSYTSFEYSNLTIGKRAGGLTVIADVTNVGSIAGKAVVQLYVAPVATSFMDRPSHELKGFEKLMLEPGETKTITIKLYEKDFSYYDQDKADFVVDRGEYEIQLAESSRNIKISKNITI